MGSPEKDMELNPVNGASSKPPENKLQLPMNDEEDVIIGRFRKISSAKSMAATNGNIQYPTDLPPPRPDDLESGLHLRRDAVEREKLLSGSEAADAKVQITKSSFRDVEKPSRFRNASATRFQMEAKPEEDATEESEDGMDSDDPLTMQDTKYGKSFRHFTREALPRLDNYRNVLSLHAAPRPTLDELHNASLSRKPGECAEKDMEPALTSTTMKFGWIKGVLMRCLLNIWGVMLFRRLSWVVGQAGVAQGMLLILTTSVVTTITALSMSAISTNGVIKGGGTYYMISRSLGPEFGGSIGLIFSLANAVACAMYVVGFEESLIELIPESAYMVDFRWDQAIYGLITIFILSGIVMIGMEWEAKAQIVLLIILLIAIVDFCIGSIIGPKNDGEIAQGFIGYNMTVLASNLHADYRVYEGEQHDFFSVFAVFFPAATGILAGANISGDLKHDFFSVFAVFFPAATGILAGANISGDLKHDLFSVFAVFFPAATGILAGANISGDLKHDFSVFAVFFPAATGILAGANISGDLKHDFFSVFAVFFPAATGILAGANISGDLKDPQKSIPKGTLLSILLTTLSYLIMAVICGWTVLRDATGLESDVVNHTYIGSCDPHALNSTCKYGLHHSMAVIQTVSGFGPLIYGGCFAATLSSALASLVSAPKVFQALCQDKLYPYLEFFAKGYGRNNEPVRGYVLTLIIAIAFILIGNLNTIAPLISNFFLAAYALINFATFHASLVKPVGWRPTFRFYNMWLSLIGSMVCVAIMFVNSWVTALITIASLLGLYLLVSYRKPDVNWGSTTQAQTYKLALMGVHQLAKTTEHVKNYRPQIMVLTGYPAERPLLTDFSYLLTKGLSLMVCGHIIQGQVGHKAREALHNRAYQWFAKRKIKSFYSVVDDVGFKEGANALIQSCGLGKLQPNILMMGFKENWLHCDRTEVNDYVEVMQ
ncbi:amino acid permease domain-containing protein [Phthorimaea operculella]|nr:amino acid permease domain-containing protein [Phthorimaea operculella]